LTVTYYEDDPKATHRRQILERLVTARQAEQAGNLPWEILDNPAYKQCLAPSLTVIITLYNYRTYVNQCLLSVFESVRKDLPGQFEILVIDDGSTDGSTALVESFLKKTALPLALVKKTFNTGLADTRNLGLRLARGKYCFILDADNWIYPDCLGQLYRAIAGTDYAAVYNIIVQFDDLTGKKVGLLSQYEWDVNELLTAPYIDAMALFDKEALLNVGGYSTELVKHGWFGWEDYDLWLKLAQANYNCKLVPQILSAYRLHSRSMLNTTQFYARKLCHYFEHKFEALLLVYPKHTRTITFGLEHDFLEAMV
jgi:glycosyltransferase involved in cell wall biosynthesis